MRFIKKNKGQILVYFLIVATMIALAGATVMQYRMQVIKRQLRINLITELKAECDGNMAQCRIASENVDLSLQEGETYREPAQMRTKAIKGFIKVALLSFKYSGPARLQWQGYVKRLNEYGLLKEEGTTAEVDPRDCRDIYDIYYEMKLFLVKAQANNYNFEF
jgi:hypothetical protein